jgi:hypothetical protein
MKGFEKLKSPCSEKVMYLKIEEAFVSPKSRMNGGGLRERRNCKCLCKKFHFTSYHPFMEQVPSVETHT